MPTIYLPHSINTANTGYYNYNPPPYKKIVSSEDLEKSSKILDKLEIPYDLLDNSIDGVELVKILMDDEKLSKLIQMLKLKAMW